MAVKLVYYVVFESLRRSLSLLQFDITSGSKNLSYFLLAAYDLFLKYKSNEFIKSRLCTPIEVYIKNFLNYH